MRRTNKLDGEEKHFSSSENLSGKNNDALSIKGFERDKNGEAIK